MTLLSNCTAKSVKDAAKSLVTGQLVAFPTETVYGLGADALNQRAVGRVYQAKGRPLNHPLIVHIASINNLTKWTKDIPEYAIKLAANFWPGPMTLILPRTDLAKDYITGGQENVGVRVPSHPIAIMLLDEFEALGGYGIAAPSANRFGKVSPTSANDVKLELENFLQSQDIILNGGSSSVGVESTIIKCIGPTPTILRTGAITISMVNNLLGIKIDASTQESIDQIRVPGLFRSHYAPSAKVFISGTPTIGDGFIALSKFSTPLGAIRLASPKNNEDFARTLYKGLRLADSKQLARVFVIPPTGDDIATAIRDRLQKAAQKE